MEKQIIEALLSCRYLPGSWDKKFPRSLDPNNLSPLQRWYLHHNGYKYRKQIGNDIMALVCKNYLDTNLKPLSRREAEKILKVAVKSPQIDLL